MDPDLPRQKRSTEKRKRKKEKKSCLFEVLLVLLGELVAESPSLSPKIKILQFFSNCNFYQFLVILNVDENFTHDNNFRQTIQTLEVLLSRIAAL